MTCRLSPHLRLAVLGFAAASLALRADDLTELVVHNRTDREQVLRSSPPEGAGVLRVRITAPDGARTDRELVPDGTPEAIAIPAGATAVIDCVQPCGTTWRKFRCVGTGATRRQDSPIWYRCQDGGNRRVHAHDHLPGPRNLDARTIVFQEEGILDSFAAFGCAIL